MRQGLVAKVHWTTPCGGMLCIQKGNPEFTPGAVLTLPLGAGANLLYALLTGERLSWTTCYQLPEIFVYTVNGKFP